MKRRKIGIYSEKAASEIPIYSNERNYRYTCIFAIAFSKCERYNISVVIMYDS